MVLQRNPVRHAAYTEPPSRLRDRERDAFEKHRKFVLNLAGDTGAEFGKRKALRDREAKVTFSIPRSSSSSSSPPATKERADALTASAP